MARDHNLAFTLIFAVLEFWLIKRLSFLLEQKLLFRNVFVYKFELSFDSLNSPENMTAYSKRKKYIAGKG